MQKIVLFTGGIETLDFFSRQIGKALEEKEYGVFYFDLDQEEEGQKQLVQFAKTGDVGVITFNFNGIRGEESLYLEDGTSIWEAWEIPCYNIVVDHPFYYHELLEKVPDGYHHISIDRDHRKYMKRFYKQIDADFFFPLAGTEYKRKELQLPMEQRPYDVVFVGNYTSPEEFEPHITRINDEYTAFYYEIINDLIAHPEMTMEFAFEKYLTREMPDIEEEDLRLAMSNMIFIDLYVRFYFRGLVVQTLADAGISIYICGKGWETLKCKHPENIISTGFVNTEQCLLALSKAKISLNVMPWFKDGAHDRIFSSMLNGAVCVTDDSRYLREHFKDEEALVYYDLKHIGELPKKVEKLLGDTSILEKIQKCAYEKGEDENWKNRVDKLIRILGDGEFL